MNWRLVRWFAILNIEYTGALQHCIRSWSLPWITRILWKSCRSGWTTRTHQSHQVGICQSLAAWVLNEACIATARLPLISDETHYLLHVTVFLEKHEHPQNQRVNNFSCRVWGVVQVGLVTRMTKGTVLEHIFWVSSSRVLCSWNAGKNRK
jgi:hypothetical protein